MNDQSPQEGARWSAVARFVPMMRWLPAYDRRRLRGDIVAGTIVAALMIPQSLGYARIAGVPVEVGLYAVPLALLAYAVLGSSPQLIVGPASTVAIVSGSLVADIASDNPEDAVAITSALAIAAGVVLIATGLLRIAWVAEFLSKPIVTGFVFGLTLTIVIGELPTLLGIPKPKGDLLGVLVRTIDNLGDAELTTAIVGGTALLVLLGGRRITNRVPWGLVVLVGSVVVSKVLDLEAEGVAMIGEVPSGLPPFELPLIPRDDIWAVVVGGMSLALVAMAEGLAATRLFATRGGYRVETENELVGMGAANIGAGLAGGLGVAGSLSKTASADQAGSKSQISALTAAVFVVVVLLALTWFFTDLPQAALSAIVVAAVWGLMDVPALRRFREVRRADFVAAMVGIGGVVLFGPLPGLGIAIVTSLLAIIYRSSSPRMEVLGRISGEKAAWGRMRGHTTRRTIPGIVVIRLDAPLFWANATAIEDRLLAEVERRPGTRAVVLDLEATSQLGTTSADMLEHLHNELAKREIQLYLARVIHPVSSVLGRSGFLDTLGDEHIWHSISQCVRAARKATGLKGSGAEVEAVDARPATSDRSELAAEVPVAEVPVAEVPVADQDVPTVPSEETPDPGDIAAEPAQPADGELDTPIDTAVANTIDANLDDLDDEVDDDIEQPEDAFDEIEIEVLDDEEEDESGLYAGSDRPRRVGEDVVDFFLRSLRDGQPRAAVADYVGARLVQHAAGIDDGADGFIEFVERFVERNPDRYVRIVRTIEDGRFAFLHTFQSLNRGETELITTDFFATDGDGRIIEHWSVVAPHAREKWSRRSITDGPAEAVEHERTDENKSVVRDLVDRVLLPGADRAQLDEFLTEQFVEHAALEDGRVPLGELAYDELVLLVGEGNFVATLCAARRAGRPVNHVDIYRLERGRIAEHWDNTEAVPTEGS